MRPWIAFDEMIAGPALGDTILYADGSTEHCYLAKTRVDIAGHYSRPDIFKLQVDRTPRAGVVEFHTEQAVDTTERFDPQA